MEGIVSLTRFGAWEIRLALTLATCTCSKLVAETYERMWEQIGEEVGMKFSVGVDWFLLGDMIGFGTNGAGLQFTVRRLE